tara:strand:- start:629 stop:874 length:246 start_codon:yes stop_codon:yes gene_type:complete
VFDFAHVCWRQGAIAKQAQPSIKAVPPIGVIAPSHRKPVILSRYKLPEKTTIPVIKRYPAVCAQGFENLFIAHEDIMTAMA